MEAAAIGAAKSALNSVVKTTTTAITDEIGLLLGVQEELFFIKEELEMMQGFLQVAKAENVKGVVVSIWVKQVQELAFDVEDCLQEASVYLMKKSCLPVMFSAKKRDYIARKIRVLKNRIEDVSKRNMRYNLINKDNGGHTYHESASTRSIANVEALLVGLDEQKKKLVELILKEHAEPRDEPWKGKVISVVGMGGLGKTTLVREVCGDQKLSDEFKYFAWVTIQHPFNIEEFKGSLAKQILSDAQENDNKGGRMEGNIKKPELSRIKSIKEKTEEKVTAYQKDKKYLIVLDDLSSLSEWDKIKDVLPLVNGSRIIVTTRYKSPLTESITHPSENIYEMKKLSKKDAFDLFYKAVYKTSNYRLVSNNEGPSSTEIIEEISEEQAQCIPIPIIEEISEEKAQCIPIPIIEEISEEKAQCIPIPIIEEISEEQVQCIPIPIIEEISEDQAQCIPIPIIEEISEEQVQCIPIPITEDMKTQAGLIINNCDLLPLAIVTVGSYLATKPKTGVEWKKMHDQLSSELANNPDLERVKTVLTSSYDGMPYHLKPCLLYLSVFHNHKEIRRSRIIRRWMADGYVMAERKKTAEEVGKGYFYDLMGRSLIQPSELSTIINGDVKNCNIHDMMYELILAKAEDENMISVLEDKHLITMTDKVRHLVIAGGPCTGDKVLERMKLSQMRSLSIFGEVGDYLRYSRMKLVRVLDLEGTLNLNDQGLRNIGKLRHLKFLGLRGTKIRKLPDSLGKLRELETLDIRNTMVVGLPTGIAKLQKLSYLRAGFDDSRNFLLEEALECICCPLIKCIGPIKCCCPFTDPLLFFACLLLVMGVLSLCIPDKITDHHSYGPRAPRGIGQLRSLNILGTIDIGRSKNLAKELQNLTNLRKLAVRCFTEENGKTLAEVIDGLKQLRSLVLEAADDSGLRCCLQAVCSPPKYLQSLKLYSPLGELPDWISSLENLEKIYFENTQLTGEIKAIGKLPNLKILYYLWHSFKDDVKELCFGEGTFPMLQVMILKEPYRLESVSIEKTALKSLEQLKIRICIPIREDGVSGLEFLEQLKEMEVEVFDTEVNKMFVSNLQEKLSMNPKKPILRVI